MSGVDAVCRGLARYGLATVLALGHAISHGRTGAVNGVVEYAWKRRAFCLVIEFAGANGDKAREITSYSVALD